MAVSFSLNKNTKALFKVVKFLNVSDLAIRLSLVKLKSNQIEIIYKF